jgi:hypothetical protein
MNTYMKAILQVVNCARDVVSEASRSHLDDDAHIPNDVFQSLVVAFDDLSGLVELSNDECEDGPTRSQRFTRLCHTKGDMPNE